MAPFRFLDLPTELRLMIYECMGISVTYAKCEEASAIFIDVAAPTAILHTCKFIHAEASPIIKKTASKVEAQSPNGEYTMPKIILSDDARLSFKPVIPIFSDDAQYDFEPVIPILLHIIGHVDDWQWYARNGDVFSMFWNRQPLYTRNR
ncbi:hypothetical protein P154DRAFT_610465 [Amniculicola lignicola CBS 123094]|uniref:F-box domain-containing protein n=1 Tax=Amniculicola lignicola CBS 123094 TaxID=1392246 RepID=A0A6A5X2H6_9PLEO|nr:hypothetical protein P154DRAFT_610465 [Amniculicola lignicola CBS 123094]